METATRRTGFLGAVEEATAVVMRAVTAERFAIRVEVRAGVAAILGVWPVDGVVMALLGPVFWALGGAVGYIGVASIVEVAENGSLDTQRTQLEKRETDANTAIGPR